MPLLLQLVLRRRPAHSSSLHRKPHLSLLVNARGGETQKEGRYYGLSQPDKVRCCVGTGPAPRGERPLAPHQRSLPCAPQAWSEKATVDSSVSKLPI